MSRGCVCQPLAIRYKRSMVIVGAYKIVGSRRAVRAYGVQYGCESSLWAAER